MRILLKNCKLLNGYKKILIEDERIGEIYSNKKEITLEQKVDITIDLKNKLVLPGIIDAHVHVRDMQQKEKEDWLSASMAALKGGITTIMDMPNTKPPTLDETALNYKRECAEKSLVHYKLHLGVAKSNYHNLEKILDSNNEDVGALKVFLAASSSNEIIEDKNYLKKIFKLAKKYDKVVIVHTELQECIDKWQKKFKQNIYNHYKIRNRECAIQGLKMVLELAEEVGNQLYIAHVSTKEEIELIKNYKSQFDNVYCEVTPHHLTLNKNILEKVGCFGKVNPPLRTEADIDALWEALSKGVIDTIGTDHAPHELYQKQKEYSQAPSGFPGLETMLAILIQEFKKRNFNLEKLIELCCLNPANIFNLNEMGKIKPGYLADLAVIDENFKWEVLPGEFFTKAKFSPFTGIKLSNKVIMTIVNGLIYDFREE